MDYHWNTSPAAKQTEINSLQEALKINPYTCQLLVQRGIKNFEEAKHYFRPQLADLYDPFLMKNMDLAVECLIEAISSGQKIMIYGDYDVDGTTSVSLVYGFLNKFHPDKLIKYIPDRYKEGYGVSDLGVQTAIDQQVGLVITLDCGIKAVQQIQKLDDAGINTIICDHHLPGTI